MGIGGNDDLGGYIKSIYWEEAGLLLFWRRLEAFRGSYLRNNCKTREFTEFDAVQEI